MQTCTKCDETKPLTEFHKSKDHRYGVRPDCKSCVQKRVADRWVQYKYGLTDEEVQELLVKQDHKCAGCGSAAAPRMVTRQRWSKIGLCVDHDHDTGRVRGLLCSACNSALGQVKDNPAVLMNLAGYLERNKI